MSVGAGICIKEPEGFTPSLVFHPLLERGKPKLHTPTFDVIFEKYISLSLRETKETEILRTTLLNIIRNNGIEVDDEFLLNNLLDKLEKARLKVLLQIIDYLIKNNYKFSIEVYETDGDLEHLYFVIHFPPVVDRKKINEEILKLAKYKRSIDKNKLLWFAGFAREREDV